MQAYEIGRRSTPRDAGRPAESLSWLASHGFATPKAWVLLSAEFCSPEAEPDGRLATALSTIVRDTATYTVRTSSKLPGSTPDDEPPPEQRVSDVAGAHELAEAVAEVRRRQHTRLSPPDRRPQSIDRLREEAPPPPEVSVLVIEEPRALISGRAYSSDPLTALDEVVIEATRGQIELLSKPDVTPDRWVRKWGTWRRQPVASDISATIVEEAADKAAEAQRRIGWPVELEWVFDGDRVCFTDLRDLDSVQGVSFYSATVAHQFLPGVQLPLVWSVNVPVVIGAWLRLVTEMVGDTGLDVHDLTRSYFYRAYFDMGTLARLFDMAGVGRETLELFALGGGSEATEAPRLRLTARSLVRAPRAIGFAATKVRLGAQVEHELPKIERRLAEFDAGPGCSDLTARQVFERVDELLPIVEDAAYLNAVTPLAAAVYTRLFARQLLAEVELEPDEVALDLAPRPVDAELDRLAEAAAALPDNTAGAAAAGKVARVRATRSGALFIADVERFLRSFGYMGAAENDFSTAPWSEDLPGVVRMLATRSVEPKGTSKVSRRRLAEMGASSALLRAFDRASRWATLTQKVGDVYARVYGRLRPLYLRLGDILVRRGWIDDPGDVFLLSPEGLERALSFEISANQLRMAIAQRAADVDYARSVEPPDVIFGEFAPIPSPPGCESLAGVGGAPGYCTGETVVVEDPCNAEGLNGDCVVVIPASDSDWREVVALAGAVVCERGGFDSAVARHARDAGIPCVVALPDAITALGNGTSVAVDGFRGSVRVVSWAEVALADAGPAEAEHA